MNDKIRSFIVIVVMAGGWSSGQEETQKNIQSDNGTLDGTLKNLTTTVEMYCYSEVF